MMKVFQKSMCIITIVSLVTGALSYAGDIETSALYRFEDASAQVGEFIADSSGNGRDAEVFLADVGLEPGQPGFGQAGAFSGNLAALDFSDVDTSGDFTFALWMKSATLDQTQKYLLSRSNGSGGGEQTAIIYQYVPNTVPRCI